MPSRLNLALALALAATPALAAEPADDETETLDTVVVTAAPVSPLTFVTDPRLPRQPVPASDGADYLKTIPGFSALRNGGTNGDPVLRGMFGSRLNLLSNDGSMPGACPARMDNPLSYVAPETYDRLTVVKGPQTVLWGPGASAGTVRFQRDTERFDEAGLRLQGSLLGGSFGRNDQVLDATVGAPLGYARLSANRSQSDDYDDGDGDGVPSEWKKWNADLALGWTPDADTVLEFTAGSGDGEARYAGRGMDGSMFKRESYGLRFEKGGFQGALKRVQANLFHNYADHLMDNYTLRDPNPMSSMPMPMASNVDRRTQGGRAAADWAWNAFELSAGVDAQRSRHRERSAMGRGAYRELPWSEDAEFRNLGLFAEATWTLAPGQRVVAGARADRAEVSDHRATVSMMGMGGMMSMPNPTAGVTREKTLSGGFLRYEHDIADSGFGWYAGLGHTGRMPDYWELFSPDMGPMGAANAFAGVEPEKTTQLDIGAQYRSERLDAWVSAYAGRVDDYILFTYSSGGMMGSMSSVANVDARIHGAEAGLEFRPAAYWKLGGSVAWAWGENRSAGTPLPQMTPLEAKLTAAYDGPRWTAGVLVRAVDAQDRVAVGQGNVVGRDLGSSAGFVTVALNGGYRFNDRLQLTAGIDNLFDRDYSEHLNLAGSADFGYPAMPVRIDEPGRSVWVKLGFKY
ncbi:TonB-dependent copper receptor [Pseudoxanthomonas kalamensis DSM 18571]|nr:TonB-dependent copper receptor [Pseudoxanthomonas kalamensis DSM 18571]